MEPPIIACDIDGTIINFKDNPRYDVIALLKLFDKFGCKIYLWSGGGISYATTWANRLGLDYDVIEKGSIIPDIIIDDESATNLGKVNIIV